MKKKETKAFRKRIFLLGKDKEGKLRWLEEPSWDCGWYWGFGYIETYTNNTKPELSRDIIEHTHFDSLFLDSPRNCFDNFKNFFVKTPFTDEEIYKLLELFKTAYTLRHSSELFHLGSSYITQNPRADLIKSKNWAGSINEVLLPSVFAEIEKILTGKEIINKYKPVGEN